MGFICIEEIIDPAPYACQHVLEFGMILKVFSGIPS
jgi:hypothetical protein